MPRYGPDSDGITIARLSGTATRHAREPGDRAAAIAELIEIATEKRSGQPPRLRTDLMTRAAGNDRRRLLVQRPVVLVVSCCCRSAGGGGRRS